MRHTCLQWANGITYFSIHELFQGIFWQMEYFKKYCHIWNISFEIFQCNITTSDPLTLLPLSAVSALPNAMIFSCLVLGQLSPFLLVLCHSGIISLLIFARLFSLLPSPRLSLALSLTFFLELKCAESVSVWLTSGEAEWLNKYLYTIQYKYKYNAIQYNTFCRREQWW